MTEDIGTVRWFGEDWGAPVCDPRTHVPTPVGAPCAGHDHMHDRNRSALIEPGDQGVTLPFYGTIAYHLACWLHEVGADRITNNNERN